MRASALLLAFALSLPTAAAAADEKKDRGSKVVCRTFEVTGSRLGGNRVCKTRDQWEADKLRTEEEALESQREGSVRDPQGDRRPPM